MRRVPPAVLARARMFRARATESRSCSLCRQWGWLRPRPRNRQRPRCRSIVTVRVPPWTMALLIASRQHAMECFSSTCCPAAPGMECSNCSRSRPAFCRREGTWRDLDRRIEQRPEVARERFVPRGRGPRRAVRTPVRVGRVLPPPPRLGRARSPCGAKAAHSRQPRARSQRASAKPGWRGEWLQETPVG
jgi:hypothetical protein